jgi:hypothetical protein
VSISSDVDTNSTESHGEYDSERDSDVGLHMEDDVDTLDGVDLHGDVEMDRNGGEEEKVEEDDEKEEEEVDEDEQEDENENGDNGKEPQTIGQGEMVDTLADDAATMVDNQATVLPEQGQQMYEHTPQPHPPAPTTQPHNQEPLPRPQTPETHSLSGLEFLRLVTLQNHRPAVPTLREAEAAGNFSDVNVKQQLLSE